MNTVRTTTATPPATAAARVGRGLGLTRVLVTCDPDNTASARTIERNGGRLEDTRDTSDGREHPYWIDL